MRILIIILGFINGAYMLADGIYVMNNAKYIGPDKPGPWAELFYQLDIDVFQLGPLFVVFGILWLLWVVGMWTRQRWSFILGIILSILTLWYLPIGTIFSVVILLVLLLRKQKLRL